MQFFAAASAVALAILPLPAHATVIGSTPSDGDTLTEAVEELSVTMSEEILQVPGVETANVLYVQDADGNYYGDGCTLIDGPTASLAAAFGEPGDYRLSYTVVSADTHPVSGEIHFTWDPAEEHEPSPAWAELPVCGEEPIPAESGAAEGETEEPAEGEASETEQAEGAEADPTDDAAAESDGAETPAEEEDGGVPPWVFIIISVAAAALILGVIIANWTRTRRMRAEYDEPADGPTDE